MGKGRAFRDGPLLGGGAERKEIHQTSCLNGLLYISQMIQYGA